MSADNFTGEKKMEFNLRAPLSLLRPLEKECTKTEIKEATSDDVITRIAAALRDGPQKSTSDAISGLETELKNLEDEIRQLEEGKKVLVEEIKAANKKCEECAFQKLLLPAKRKKKIESHKIKMQNVRNVCEAIIDELHRATENPDLKVEVDSLIQIAETDPQKACSHVESYFSKQ